MSGLDDVIAKNNLGSLIDRHATPMAMIERKRPFASIKEELGGLLAIHEMRDGTESSAMATSLNNLAMLLSDQGHLTGARLYPSSLAISSRKLCCACAVTDKASSARRISTR